MNGEACAEMHLLIQADIDGELLASEAARVAAHLERCAACAEVQAQLMALSDRLRRDVPREMASVGLRARVQTVLTQSELSVIARPATPAASVRRRPMLAFGAGFALAASVMLAVMVPRLAAAPEDLARDAVVAAHIRALQPGHLMDVASEDRHTVKPWFDGRTSFAPPVKDLAALGFPLAGGRLEYFGGRTAAAMVYRRGLHVIDLFAAAGTDGGAGGSVSASAHAGYNVLGWSQDDTSFWAVSDLNADELAQFVRDWRAG